MKTYSEDLHVNDSTEYTCEEEISACGSEDCLGWIKPLRAFEGKGMGVKYRFRGTKKGLRYQRISKEK